MSEPIPYVDYVRIEIRIAGRTEVLELTPQDWSGVQAEVVVESLPEPFDSDYGEPSLTRVAHQRTPRFRMKATGGVARLTVNELRGSEENR